MVKNELKEVERSLRYIAKRNKNITYSIGLVLMYLMLGMNAFSEEVITNIESQVASKQEISASTDKLSEVLKKIKEENDKKLKGAQLELVQLMEQGDQVVKSPWASWQFGMNFMYSDWGGSYRGRGDKAKRYPYEGIFTRSTDIFERSVSPESKQYSKLRKITDPHSATSSSRTGLNIDYGLASTKIVKEPISSFEVSASITPRSIVKGAITIAEKKVEVPEQPKAVVFNEPSINILVPAAPIVSVGTPTVTAPTVPDKEVAIPALPKAIEFTEPKINVDEPKAPTVKASTPNVNPPTVPDKKVGIPNLPKAIVFTTPEIKITAPAAPSISVIPPEVEVPDVQPKTLSSPDLPGAITFTEPTINITVPAASIVSVGTPTVTAPTVPDKEVAIPALPKAITFTEPTINITVPAAPIVSVGTPTVEPPSVNPKTVDTPKLPDAIDFNPITPFVEIPADPALPPPPGFKVIVGADCNSSDGVGCSTGATPLKGKAGTDGYEYLQYTWQSSYEKQGLAFKWFDAVTSGTKIYGNGTDFNETTSVTIGTDTFNGKSRTSGTTISINSYNGLSGLSASTNTNPVDRNKQYFLVGGSRAIEADMSSGRGAVINQGTVNLAGILTLGMVTQTSDNTNYVINNGTITDVNEKNDNYIKDVKNKYNTDTNGDGTNDVLRIYGPFTEVYDTKLSNDGYVGYKIGMAVVPENTNRDKSIVRNTGNINFYGANSIGMYVYLPTTLGAKNTTFDGTLLNSGNITLTGKESYGMKIAGKTGENTEYENAGNIILKKNGRDAANGSAGMALMDDNTVVSVSLTRGKAVNKGTISLKDVQNSIGTYVNIDSDITNAGNITINSNIATATSGEQPVNIAMRADGNKNAEVINKSNGQITLDGSYAIAMLANGSKLKNEGKITTGTAVSNAVGISALNGASMENKGSIILKGEENNIGVFLKGSTGKVATSGLGSSIEVSGDKSTGVLATKGTTASNLMMEGNVKVSGKAISGIVVNESTVKLDKTATVTVDDNGAAAGASGDRGSYGILVKGASGSFVGENTTVAAKVSTNKSAGLYSEGVLKVNKTNIKTENGAINFFAKDNGTIEIIGTGSESETGQKSLLFYTDGNNSKIKLTGDMKATIKGGTDSNNRGTAFLYRGNNYDSFNSTAIENWAKNKFGDGTTSTLGNLTLNMEDGSRLFVASDVGMNLSDTNPTGLAAALGGATINGSNYKTFMLYDSKLTINQDVNLNESTDPYNNLEISSSSVVNNSEIKGSNANQVAIAQENTSTTDKTRVTLENNNLIELTGTGSTGIYAKFGVIKNNAAGTISVGNNSTGIYALNNTEVSNAGEIKIDAGSTGIFYSDIFVDKVTKAQTVYDTTTSLKNANKITLKADNSVGMIYAPGNINGTVTFENNGEISGTGKQNVGMFAKVAKNDVAYDTINAKTIKLGDADTAANLNIGMYTDATVKGKTPLKNTGTIEVGKHGIGMYGFDLSTTGNITAGNAGIALYSQDGNVNITGTPTIKVGADNSVAVYTKGSSQTITSNGATYDIGGKSYGFVNVGTGNILNISGGSGTLTDNGIFIYSEDTTGNITNSTSISSTGNTGENIAIFSKGTTTTNNGAITFEKGTGNVGIYGTSGANIINNAAIKLGKSTDTKRSIGLTTNKGIITNTGTINIGSSTIDGKYGIGLYTSGTGTINNSGDIKIIGDETTGAYANGTSNINLTGGTVKVEGNKSTGYYLDKGTSSSIASGAEVKVVGNETTGLFVNAGTLSYEGLTGVKGDGVYGIVAGTGSTINTKGGSLTVEGSSGASNQSATRGTTALVVSNGGNLLGGKLAVTAKVAGDKSMGLYSAGNLNIDSANITTSNGAVNFFAENGTISVGNNKGASTVVAGTGTDRGSLLFYAKGTGKILINGPMTATIKGSSDPTKTATAFLYKKTGSTYSSFTTTEIENWAKNSFGDGTISTLNNLTLNMEDNSRLFVASNVAMNLSDTNPAGLATALGGVTINGSNYKTFMLYDSKLIINQSVNLDNPADLYNQLEISSSSVVNNSEIKGSNANQVAIAQENTSTTDKTRVTLENNNLIELTGTGSTGIYAKFGVIKNNAAGTISVGNNSTGIYALNNTEVSNAGEIKIDAGSTGIFYSDIFVDKVTKAQTVYDTTTSLKNANKITLKADNSVGMIYAPGNINGTVTFENNGEISGTGKQNVGMFAKVAKNDVAYDTINAKTIKLGDADTAANLNIGMYTDATVKGKTPLKNTGTIEVGKHGIGMYGFDLSTTGNITAGNAGIALYSQDGNVNITGTPTIKVGADNSVAVYTKGSSQTITSNGATYDIGGKSYGFVNVGTGNILNISGGSGTLTDNGIFIYSEDTTGNITNSTSISSTGNTGENIAIFSKGTKTTNNGAIIFKKGTGNVGIYGTSGANITNNAAIELGKSTKAKRSIGLTTDNGIITNTGTINIGSSTIEGDYGIVLYTSDTGTIDTGTINNSGDIEIIGDETTGAYANRTSNINLTGGTVKVKGNKSTGYYLDKGISSSIASGAEVKVVGNETTGLFVNAGTLSYEGLTGVKGDGVYGIVAGTGSTINTTGGSLTVEGSSGASNQSATRGTTALVVSNGGNLLGGKLAVTAKVAGDKSMGLYSAGNLNIDSANITTSNGAVNFFAENGTISVGNNKGASTVVAGTGTDRGSLLFYAKGTGKILINGSMTATVEGDPIPKKSATAFLYKGVGGPYSKFTATEIKDWAKNSFGDGTKSTLNNLTLEMKDNSRLFVASNVAMNLSDTNPAGLATALGGVTINGSNYKTFMLYDSKLIVNQNVNLDNPADLYNQLEMSNSSVVNNSEIKGSNPNQTAIAQENNLTPKSKVTLENNNLIELKGIKSTGIYAKFGVIKNNAAGTISVGKKSTGIYAQNNTEVTNAGEIKIGEESTGIFYSDVGSKIFTTTTSLKNANKIILTADNSVGMIYAPGNINGTVTFENNGEISGTGKQNVGMFAKVAKNNVAYDTINAKTIKLGDADTAANLNIGMYTDATVKGKTPLKNTGTIEVGKHGIGMYGFDLSTTGNITAGNAGIALYSQDGNVNITGTPTIKVGADKAVAVYTKGSSQTITSNGATYDIGGKSYGFVNVGTGNILNISGGSGTLTDNGIFIYSEDTTGNITNSTSISSTGNTGENIAIFSKGTKTTNNGAIIFKKGTGNVGIYGTSGANITNNAAIELGKSTKAKRSIGLTTDNGIITNTGTIKIEGDYGIVLYTSDTGTINNSGDIEIIGDETTGAYANRTSNINLTGGTVKVKGNKSTGYYLDKGISSSIASGAKVKVEGNETTGLFVNAGTLSYEGLTEVKGDGVYGIVAGTGSRINTTGGSLTVEGSSGASNQSATRGTAALVVNNGGEVLGGKLDVTAKVAGDKSIGLYSAGNLNIDSANITTSNGAVNFFAENGTISVGNNKGASTVVAGTGADRGSILFYAPTTTSKILINSPMTATVEGSTDSTKTATAFLYQGSGSKLTTTEIGNWAKNSFGDGTISTLNKLTLNMKDNSRLFVASNVAMNLSDTNPAGLATALGGVTINGSNYKTFMLYDSKLIVNQNVNLDNPADLYNQLEMSNSSVVNNSEIKGSNPNQTAIAQENNLTPKSKVTLENNKLIELTGAGSTGIYAKFGVIKNNAAGTISVGKKSTGIYALNNTEVSNAGEIKIGEESTGIFYSDVTKSETFTTTTSLKNAKKITLTANNSVGMIYEPGNINGTVTFENNGEISGTGKQNVGMFAKVAKNNVAYDTINAGTINLGDADTAANLNIGMYTDATVKGKTPLKNTGTIEVGKHGIGMYGFDLSTTGNITAGNAGIALYSQDGNVNITGTPTIKVGADKAVAVYTKGSSQTITSNGATYDIGEKSYGFVNVGTGNTLNILGGSGTLTDNGIFIYSEDTTGNITNSTDISSTGNTGENIAIFSKGTKTTNNGAITFEKGTGNVGIYGTSGANITNNAAIKLGKSTDTKRSIGLTTDNGIITNTGTINIGSSTIDGKYGIGLYTSGTGTINNSGDIEIIGDETTGAYANGTSNINLKTRTVKVKGNKSTGYYLDKGTSSSIASGAKVKVEGNETTGLFVNAGTLSYEGLTEVKGDGVYGIVAGTGSRINTTGGSLTVEGSSGASNQSATRGTAALVVNNGGEVLGGKLDVTAKVAGDKSIGLYSAGNLNIDSANITTSNGAVNFYAQNGTISVGNNKGASTVVAGTGPDRGSLLFYAKGTGKILINGSMTATVEGDPNPTKTATAFLYKGNNYSKFNNSTIKYYADTQFGGTLGNLTLDMKDNSRLFVASDVEMNLKDTDSKALSTALGGAKIIGTKYKTFMLYDSKLIVNQNVNLDNSTDSYNRLEMSNSSVVNNSEIKGSNANQVAIAQENNLTPKSKVTLENNKLIELTGTGSTGIYAKFGVIKNNAAGTISVGKKSTGIYALNNTEVSNAGEIKIGEESTGIFYSDVTKSETFTTTTSLKNAKKITLTANNSVGMIYEPGNINGTVTFENNGEISGTGKQNVGMFAKVAKNNVAYDTINAKTINLGDADTAANLNIGMYTDATVKGKTPLKNTGTIKVGKHGIGMYGFDLSTTGNITAGNAGIALYSQDGNVNITGTPTIKVGADNSVAVYTKGSSQTITSNGATYDIGEKSYGFVNVGTGNILNISGGSGTLTDNGIFIYSEDKTGNITNSTDISSTGNTGENIAIFSKGTKTTNNGAITFEKGTGNVGIYGTSGANITNNAAIKLGKSTDTKRSIGLTTDNGIITNTGTINIGSSTIDGKYGIGLYTSGTGTINNSGDIEIIGDETTGAYANGTSNINLKTRTVKVKGNKSTGYYLDKGTSSSIASGAKVKVEGNETTGLFVNAGTLSYEGLTEVKGDGVYGIVAGTGSRINTTGGSLTVEGSSGASNQSATRGTAALVVNNGGEVLGGKLDVTAKVAGDKSIGLYSAGNLNIDSANITTSNGAVNFFSQNGTISIGNNKGASTVIAGTGTNRGSLLFYVPTATSKILINGSMIATVEGSTDPTKTASAFYYNGNGTLGNISTYTTLNPTNFATWAKNKFGNGTTSTLGNLTLNMEANSRLFLTGKVNLDLSSTSVSNLFAGLGTSEKPTILGSDYKTFMLYQSHLNINQLVNLDNAKDAYNQLEISNSSITNNNIINGTQSGQAAIAQKNSSAVKNVVTLINNGTINLTGDKSTAIYGDNAIINNTAGGKISVGNSSTALYGLNNTEISNNGNIKIGSNSTGMFYSDIFTDKISKVATVYNTTSGLKNVGVITIDGDSSIGMTYEPGNMTGSLVFENSGTIKNAGTKNIGMFAKVSKNKLLYNSINSGIISLGGASSLSDPSVGMYTNATSVGTNLLTNTGNITIGDNSVAMYGYEEINSGDIKVGNAAIALYSKGGDVKLTGGKITTGTNEAVVVYTVGNGQNIINSGTTFELADNSFGFVNVGKGNKIESTLAKNTLRSKSVYIYSNDTTGEVKNNTKLISNGDENYAIYSAGKVFNNANIDFRNGIGNVAIYSIKGGEAYNNSEITIGSSDLKTSRFAIAMAAGYDTSDTGYIENTPGGIINVNGAGSIGMYASGRNLGTKYDAVNGGTIRLNANGTTGIFLDNGAKGLNTGTIETATTGLLNVVGVYVSNGAELENSKTGKIIIDATNGIGAYKKGGIFKNYGIITVKGSGAENEYVFKKGETGKTVDGVEIDTKTGVAIIKRNGKVVIPKIITTNMTEAPKTISASSIGMYVDTSGISHTNPIGNLGLLTKEADLIIGSEASGYTTEKDIVITDPKIINPYRDSQIANAANVTKWSTYSGSATWLATAILDSNNYITGIAMSKIPYVSFAGKEASPVEVSDTFNFLNGLEQRYGVEGLGTIENSLFQKLNKIGKNEQVLLYQAFDEMMGHQYANVQQRIHSTGQILDKEFDYLKDEWRTASKDSNKVKVFGMKGEYSTDTAGIIDYKNNAYGVAYVGENETVKLGNTTGWYTGLVHNTFKFKDIGNSKEEMLQAKLGLFNSKAFDDNNSLNWTISGEAFVGYNKMHRKFLVVDEIFNARSRYWSYGVALKNELSKTLRLSEDFSLRGYGSIKVEYGRFQKINEKSGEIKLEVKANDYISIKPEIGGELIYKTPLSGRNFFNAKLGVAYENELGRVGDAKNKARVAHTTADWFNIRGEKEDRRGNVKTDFSLGWDNEAYGITANIGYDTKGKNRRAGLGLRVIF